MRVPLVMVACVALATGPETGTDGILKAQSPGGDATATLAAARHALGGEQRIAAVKTLVATGQTKQVRGDNLVPIEFEINIEFPDKQGSRRRPRERRTSYRSTGRRDFPRAFS